MRFTTEQYDKALEAIELARTQLEPNGHSCHICGGSGHQAFECGRNPLVAMQMCEMIAKRANELHDAVHASMDSIPAMVNAVTSGEMDSVKTWVDDGSELMDTIHEFLHGLAGFNVHLGMQVGPARVVLP